MIDNDWPDQPDDDISGQNELEALREVDNEVATRLVALELLGITFRAKTNEIEQVVARSTAERAGLQVRDTILFVNNCPTPRSDDLIAAIQRHPSGTPVHVTVHRDEATLTIKVDLDASHKRPTPEPNCVNYVEF